MNSACNPIIYALRSKAFRDGYKQLWCQVSRGPISEGETACELVEYSGTLALPRPF